MQHNPADLDVSTYECYECGTRVESEAHQGTCPDCAGSVRNITVVRE
ncbi:rubrerythrin-like domain-containing protein [Halosegnis marinus]|uniref:Rubrerythrin-like domain-containing protein n=1 Tax=Halosegnis marinus TaxID=3034023 RepID=A0ABD5ZKA4_9EURY|nr:rubrerythrin-like domain-containing protein [Halosegnis sp. DT85]